MIGSRSSLAPVATVLALLLTGCAAGSADGDPGSAPDGSAGGDDTSMDEHDTADARAEAVDCLHGVWSVTEADLSTYYGQMSAETGITILPAGSAELALDGDAMRYGYSAEYDLGMDLEGADAFMSIGGVLGGEFDLDEAGETILFTATGEQLTTVLEINGVVVPQDVLDDSIDSAMATDPFRDGSFACTDETLTLAFTTGHGEVPLELDRIG